MGYNSVTMVDYRLKSFFSTKCFIVLAILIIAFSLLNHAAIAQQNDNLLEPMRLSSQQANNVGLKRQAFDFKNSKLNFETFVPDNAQLELNAYDNKPVVQGQIGSVIPLGTVKMSYDDIAIEDTIYLYKLRYAPAALRICQWQMEKNNYSILHSTAQNKFSDAELLGIQEPVKGTIPINLQLGYCYARGDVLVAHFFSSSFSDKDKTKMTNEDKEKDQKTLVTLRKVVSYFAANMIMADGKENALDQNIMKNLAVNLDGRTLMLTYPEGIDVVVNNSARKILPYEFHFVQKFTDGEIFSHLFLLINKTSEPESEESFRRQADIFAKINLSSQLTNNEDEKNKPSSAKNTVAGNKNNAKIPEPQSNDSAQNIQYKFVARHSIDGFAEAGIMARSYQYKIIEKDKPDHSTYFFVSVIGYKDKTYILSYHSLRSNISESSEFFSGLVGDVAYDSLRQSIYDFLTRLK